jgi:hypothetical protein
MYPIGVNGADLKNYAVAFRGTSNQLPFISNKYNAAQVHTNTNKTSQLIIMDAQFNAQFDVNVLASAFNMEKADFMGKLELIDDFTTFDNERFDIIREGSDQIELVTADELALMQNVKAILLDEEWFQVYDNLSAFSETYVASGLYWNYFYNIWKTVSTSPFSNAIVFVDDSASTQINSMTFTVETKSDDDVNTVLTLIPTETETLGNTNYTFTQTEAATEAGIAVHRYGAIIIPNDSEGFTPEIVVNGKTLTASAAVTAALDVGDTVTFTAE